MLFRSLSFLLTAAICDNWAVIYTGSRSFGNYRHTADSFYQYHLLIQNGFDKEKIILMNYDDIVDSYSNKFKGHIYRTLTHVPDVYPGSANIDYTGKTVTAANFYKVLTGDATAGGKVLKSTENDNVFVFFDDHGGNGILGVPEGCGGYIYANDLKKTFKTMADKKMFGKLFFPITACYAGSVAKYLDDIPNMYVMTASNDHESSWGDLYDNSLGTCLTSEYSLIKDQFQEQYPEGTLEEMFKYCVANVKQSHVCEYGDKSLKTMKISDFVLHAPTAKKSVNKASSIIKIDETRGIIEQAKLASVNKAYFNVLSTAEKISSHQVDSIINNLKAKFMPVDADLTESTEIKDWDAYKKVLTAMQEKVQNLGESFYAKTFFFSNLINGSLTCVRVDGF